MAPIGPMQFDIQCNQALATVDLDVMEATLCVIIEQTTRHMKEMETTCKQEPSPTQRYDKRMRHMLYLISLLLQWEGAVPSHCTHFKQWGVSDNVTVKSV